MKGIGSTVKSKPYPHSPGGSLNQEATTKKYSLSRPGAGSVRLAAGNNMLTWSPCLPITYISSAFSSKGNTSPYRVNAPEDVEVVSQS